MANNNKGLLENGEAPSTYHYLAPYPSQPTGIQITRNGGQHSEPLTDTSDDIPIHIAEADAKFPRKSPLQQFVQNYRLLEFSSALLLYLLGLVFARIAVHERPIPGIKVRLSATALTWSLDPSIDEKKMPEEVPMWLLLSLGTVLPIGANLIVNYVLPRFSQVRVIAHDTRDFLLSLFLSTALATFLTQFIKNITGRFRPSFYDMCKWNDAIDWDGVTNLCMDAAGEKEGRKSFPSGHASFAWSSLLVLSLYLLGRSSLNSKSRSISTLQVGKKSLMLSVCCAPILLASWISITRCIDNWHHYSDILAGTVIGAVSATFAVSYNYESIYSHDSAGLPHEEIHDRTMKNKETENTRVGTGNSRPQLRTHMSSDYIVDLSTRSRD